MIFQAVNAGFRYPGAEGNAVSGASLNVDAGELVGVVGPNGSGKSTLLRLLLGTLAPTTGSVLTAGAPATSWSRRDLARIVGAVLQREEPAFPIRVREAVTFGRYPHLTPLGGLGNRDHDVVRAAIEACDIQDLTRRWVSTLSGGEWQRVRVARALAQEPQALVLDEPTTSLDVRHEMEVFHLVRDLVRDRGVAGIVVSHHINLAARFVDRMVVMDRGEVRGVGAPASVVDAGLLTSVFEWPVEVREWRGSPQFIALLRDHDSPSEHR